LHLLSTVPLVVFILQITIDCKNIRNNRLDPIKKSFGFKKSFSGQIAEINSTKKVLSCPDCGILFTRKRDVKRHRQSIHNQKKFTCSDCNGIFSRKDIMKRHQKKSCKAAKLSDVFSAEKKTVLYFYK